MSIYLSMQRVPFSRPDAYEKFKVLFADTRRHLMELPGFLHLTWWEHAVPREQRPNCLFHFPYLTEQPSSFAVFKDVPLDQLPDTSAPGESAQTEQGGETEIEEAVEGRHPVQA
jgi:hypothetical protein